MRAWMRIARKKMAFFNLGLIKRGVLGVPNTFLSGGHNRHCRLYNSPFWAAYTSVRIQWLTYRIQKCERLVLLLSMYIIYLLIWSTESTICSQNNICNIYNRYQGSSTTNLEGPKIYFLTKPKVRNVCTCAECVCTKNVSFVCFLCIFYVVCGRL